MTDSWARLNRRRFAAMFGATLLARRARARPLTEMRARVRPGDPDWPDDAEWQAFGRKLADGVLIKVHSPLQGCARATGGADCEQLAKLVGNPYALSDEVALTQTQGWVDAWSPQPSVYAVAARNAADVMAAVNFARERHLRLVIKGGGHSYQGGSNAPDSLLIWTRRLREIHLHEHFQPEGCTDVPACQAVSVGAGALWADVYDAVSTRGGGYVQGGGCMTVGVAGLVQSGGFGSFSKAFGTASSHLLEAEIVTADGVLRVVNARQHPELFWALKGGGGSSFGVVTRLTLKVHDLPKTFGAVNFKVRARSPQAYRRLIGYMLDFCAEHLIGPHWGEQLRFHPEHTLAVQVVFQGLTRSEAGAVWQPFFEAVRASGGEWQLDFSLLKVVATSARDFWAPTLLKRALGLIARDPRAGAPEHHVFWPGDQAQVGQVIHAYGSSWLPKALLEQNSRERLGEALFAASRNWSLALHLNKGLAGAPAAMLDAARDSALHPAALDAFALLICGAEQPGLNPASGVLPIDVATARRRAEAVRRTMAEIRRLVPETAAYPAEADYFQAGWQNAFWGEHYLRLLATKKVYDPEGLFFCHNGVGSEAWSKDGFTPLTTR